MAWTPPRLAAALSVGAALAAPPAQALDLDALWNFRDPAGSEQRFREALATARGDDALVLQTQIARSLGLRRQFERAREVLSAMQPQLEGAGAEPRVRHALEWGRSWASATHPPEALTADAKREARAAWERALALARQARLDGLAIDAIHMFAFIDTAPADQERYAREALTVSVASNQPAARRWEASIRHNLGYALHQQGRHDDALAQFRQSRVLREAAGNPGGERVARWMIAWTLRAMRRGDEALEMQLALERDHAAAGTPDAYVFEELEILYRERGDAERARRYADKLAALRQETPK